MTTLRIWDERWPLAQPFRIARGSIDAIDVVLVEIADGAHRGRGECRPYARYHESVAGVIDAIRAVEASITAGADRQDLLGLLPAGAARNAVDSALLDLEWHRDGIAAWRRLGLTEPRPCTTAYTIGLDDPQRMREAAAAQCHRPLLKVKLGGDGDIERVAAVRAGAPHSRLIVDANEAWHPKVLWSHLDAMHGLGVALVEQPLPAGDDGALAEHAHAVPVCADESCHTHLDLPALVGRYDMVNLKLDKTGGPTAAALLLREARRLGLGVMIGCMVSTSLAIAAASLFAPAADVVDLDGPLLLARDRAPGIRFEGSTLFPPPTGLWGG